jgi:integrase
VLSYAVELGKIAGNPCEGIKQLYSVDRAGIIWTDADIARIKQTCTAEIAHAVDLAAHTGLRLGNLLRLSWSHLSDDEIVITTGKSKYRREVVIPLYDALRAVLARVPRRSPTILTNSKHRPWTRDGFGSSFNKAKIAAGTDGTDLHFHDLRGTAATRFCIAHLSERAIAGIVGWEEERVSKIIRRYVDRSAATKAIIRQLNERGT